MRTVPDAGLPKAEPVDGSAKPKGRSEQLNVVPRPRLGPRKNLFEDRAFRAFVVLCSIAILTIVGLIVFELLRESRISMAKFGFKFLVKQVLQISPKTKSSGYGELMSGTTHKVKLLRYII